MGLRDHVDQDKQRFDAQSHSVRGLMELISPGVGQILISLAWNIAHHVSQQHALDKGVDLSDQVDYDSAWRQNISDLKDDHALSTQLVECIRDMAWSAAECACKQRSSWAAHGAKEPEHRFHEHADTVLALLREKLH